MRRVNLIAAAALILLGLYVIVESHSLSYWVGYGPGPGFFPSWLGGGLILLTLAWVRQILSVPARPLPRGFVPEREGALRVVAILIAMVLFYLLIEVLGFKLTMLAFLLFLLTALGRQKWWLTVPIALVGSFGTYWMFVDKLDVHLAHSSIEFLANLGF